MALPGLPFVMESVGAIASSVREFLDIVAITFFSFTMSLLLLSQLTRRPRVARIVWNHVYARHLRKLVLAWGFHEIMIVAAAQRDTMVDAVTGLAIPTITLLVPLLLARQMVVPRFSSVARRRLDILAALHATIALVASIESRYTLFINLHVLMAWITWITAGLFFLDEIVSRPLATRVIQDRVIQHTYMLRTEYVIVLEMATMHVPAGQGVSEPPREWQGLTKEEQRFIDFFTSKWYFVAVQSHLLVGFRVVIKSGSYKAYLTLVARGACKRRETTLLTLNSAVERICASIKAELGVEPAIVAGRSLHETGITTVPPWITRARIPNTLTLAREVYLPGTPGVRTFTCATRVKFKSFIDPLATQKFLKQHTIDAIIAGALKHGLHMHYFFNLDCTRTKLSKDHTVEMDKIYEIEHGGTYTRNFDYTLMDARFGAGCVVFSPSIAGLRRDIERAEGLVGGALETEMKLLRFSWQVRSALKPVMANQISNWLRTHLFFRFCQFPTIISPEQERVITLDVEAPSITACKAGTLPIGKVMVNGKPMHEFFLRQDDLKKHAFISGMTGTGKSTFVRNFIKEWIQAHPTIPFMLVEIKGEYADIARDHPDVKLLRPGVDFFFNAFGDGRNPRAHAEKMYDILETSFNLDKYKDFSPQMEKILVDVLHATAAREDPRDRTFPAFFNLAKQYIADNKATIPFIESSWIGIENRLRKLTTGPLHVVFNTPHVEIPFEELYNTNVIINLGELVKLGASKDDMYFVSNMLLKFLFDVNVAAGASEMVKHLTIIEDAQYFERRSHDGPRGKSSYFEDFGMLLRGTGEVFMAISTRPSLSVDVLANAGMIIAFQTRLQEDIDRMKSLLHLQAPDISMLEVLPEFKCLVKVNSIPRPFLLQVAGIPAGNREPDGVKRDLPALDDGNSDRDESDAIIVMVRELHNMEEYLWKNYRCLAPADVERLRSHVEIKRAEIKHNLSKNDLMGGDRAEIERIARACNLSKETIAQILESP